VPDATNQFINYISSIWDQSIPVKTLWTLQFMSLPSVIRNVDTILSLTERTNTSERKFPTNPYMAQVVYGNFTAPTLLAQKVNLPTDGFAAGATSNNNMGGLYGGYLAYQREAYTPIVVEFLETNRDITDFILRPWSIAASYKGLIEDNEYPIKTDMLITQYSKYDQTSWGIRKTVKFEGVVPSTVPGDTLGYSAEFNAAIVRPVTFAYKRYYMLQQ